MKIDEFSKTIEFPKEFYRFLAYAFPAVPADGKASRRRSRVTSKPADGFGRAQQCSAVLSSVGEQGTGKPPLGGTAPIGPRVAVVPLHSYPRRGLTGIC